MGLTATVACGVVVAVALAEGPVETSPGAKAFQKCYACHSLDLRETNLPGPNLHKLFGRVAGSLPGFDYSDAMVAAGLRKGLIWDEGNLDQYLADPESLVPGTRMALVSIQDPKRATE